MKNSVNTEKEKMLIIVRLLEKKENRIEKTQLWLSIFMLLSKFISLFTDIVPNVIRDAIIFIWLIFSVYYLYKKDLFTKFMIIVAPAIIAFVILFTKVGISGNMNSSFFDPIKVVYHATNIIYAILFACTIIAMPKDSKRFIFIIFSGALVITCIPSILYCFEFGNSIRDGVDKFALVDFTYIYAILPLVGAFFVVVKFGESKKIKVITTIFLLVEFLLLLIANFATAFLFMLFIIGFILITRKKTKAKNIFIFLFILLALVFLLKELISTVLYEISDLSIFSEIMKRRLVDLGNFFSGNGGGNSISARLTLMTASFKSFLKYPFFGIPFELFNRDTIGLHETWISILGYGGIVVFIAMITSLVLQIIYTSKSINNFTAKQHFYFLLFVFIVLGFLNPVLEQMNLFILLGIVPCMGEFLKDYSLVEVKDTRSLRNLGERRLITD